MNKTVKTIAWICLVLGLLGLAVDIGVYVHGRTLFAQRQAAIEAGEVPALRGPRIGADNNSDSNLGDAKNSAPDRDGWFQGGGMLDGRRGFNTFSDRRGGFPGGMRDGRMGRGGLILPFLFLVSGPMLTVVGAVMLIVNRTPNRKENSGKKESSSKKESSKKK